MKWPDAQTKALRIRQTGSTIEAVLVPIIFWDSGHLPVVLVEYPDLIQPWPGEGYEFVIQPSGRVDWLDDQGRVLDVYDSLCAFTADQRLMLLGSFDREFENVLPPRRIARRAGSNPRH